MIEVFASLVKLVLRRLVVVMGWAVNRVERTLSLNICLTISCMTGITNKKIVFKYKSDQDRERWN